MAQEVLMPKEGITVETCLIGTWHKKIGDAVKEGDVLFDYETDKATFECASTVSGILLHCFGESGDEVAVLTPVAIVGETGEDISDMIKSAQNAPEMSASPAPVATASSPEKVENPVERVSVSTANDSGVLKASPRARAISLSQGVDLSMATPTGPGGRIIASDVIAAAAQKFEGTMVKGHDRDIPEYTEEPLTKIRSVIAKSMLMSLQNSAQLTHHHSFDATNALAMRAEFKEIAEEQGFSGVSVGDIILYVTSRLLAVHPEINAHLIDGSIYRKYNAVHLGVAVDTPRGLMVPTVFNADRKSLRQISAEVKELAVACREGGISPDKLSGATFTVSNLGATGVEIFTPIINPPQVAIVGVCGVVDRVRHGKGGRPEIYPSIGLSLTYDHRAVDGAPASRFAAELGAAIAGFSWKTLYLEGQPCE